MNLSDIRKNLAGYAVEGHELLSVANGATFSFGAMLMRAQADIGSNPKYKGTWVEWAKGEFPDVSQSALYLARDAAEVAEVLGDVRGGSVSGIGKLARILKHAGNAEGDRETAEGLVRDTFAVACEGLKANGRVSAAAIQAALDAIGVEGTRGPSAGTPRPEGESEETEESEESGETGTTEESEEKTERNTPTVGETTPDTDPAAILAASKAVERIAGKYEGEDFYAIALAVVSACETHGVSVVYSAVKTAHKQYKKTARDAARQAEADAATVTQ